MPIKPLDFLAQSQRLIQLDEEVEHRSAVSRAYYCAFHACTKVCDALGVGPSIGSKRSHEEVIDCLTSVPSTKPFGALKVECKALGIELRKGKKLRKCADYQLDRTLALSDAKSHLAKMGMINVRANSLMPRILAATTNKSA